MLCMALKTIILPVWMPIGGLLCWYIFYKNILEDADGRSLLEIFRNPNTGHPHEFLLTQDKKNGTHTRTWIAFQGHHAQNQCQLASIRSITE